MKILYHGSTEIFSDIDLKFCKLKKDFGKGFYTTDEIQIAKEWALGHQRCGKAYLYLFKVDMSEIERVLRVHKFKDSIAWVDYIIGNRTDIEYSNNDYDVVIGKIADAMTQKEIDKFCRIYGGLKATNEEKKMLLKRLTEKDLKNQFCFKSDLSIRYLSQIMQRKEIINNERR